MTLEQLLNIIVNTMRAHGGGSPGFVPTCSGLLGDGFMEGLPSPVIKRIRIAEVELSRDIAASKVTAYEAILQALTESDA